MKQYTINIIGETSALAGVINPETQLVINIDQLAILERFSNQRIDRKAQKIYTINGCEFTVSPFFTTNVLSEDMIQALKK